MCKYQMQRWGQAGKMFGVDHCTCHIIIVLSYTLYCSLLCFGIHFTNSWSFLKGFCRSCTENMDEKLVPFLLPGEHAGCLAPAATKGFPVLVCHSLYNNLTTLSVPHVITYTSEPQYRSRLPFNSHICSSVAFQLSMIVTGMVLLRRPWQ